MIYGDTLNIIKTHLIFKCKNIMCMFIVIFLAMIVSWNNKLTLCNIYSSKNK